MGEIGLFELRTRFSKPTKRNDDDDISVFSVVRSVVCDVATLHKDMPSLGFEHSGMTSNNSNLK